MRGSEIPADEPASREWLRNPLPPGDEDPSFASLRLQLGISDNSFYTDKGFGSLGYFERQVLLDTLAPGFYREHNPILRHTVLRRRKTLREAGLPLLPHGVYIEWSRQHGISGSSGPGAEL